MTILKRSMNILFIWDLYSVIIHGGNYACYCIKVVKVIIIMIKNNDNTA